MSNSFFHVLTFWGTAFVCCGLAIIAFSLLQKKMAASIEHLKGSGYFRVLRVSLIWLLLLAAFSGFFSVSFRGCDKRSYAEIVADRSALIVKNQQQVSVSAARIEYLLGVFAFLFMAGFIFYRNKMPGILKIGSALARKKK